MKNMINAIHVEVIVDGTNKVWVNIDGVCVARVGHADKVNLEYIENGILKQIECVDGRINRQPDIGVKT